jgi:hypothetical protein
MASRQRDLQRTQLQAKLLETANLPILRLLRK